MEEKFENVLISGLTRLVFSGCTASMCLSRMSKLGKTLPQLQVICCCPASILPLLVPPSSRGTAVGVWWAAAEEEDDEPSEVVGGVASDGDGVGAEDSGGGRGSISGEDAAEGSN